MLIAQITDFHIKARGRLSYEVVDTGAFLERAVAALQALEPRPDVVLATGDLADFGRPEEYAELRRLLAPLEIPLYLIPGNHDERRALFAAFPEHRYLGRDGTYLHYVVDDYPLRLIGLDTVVAGRPEGGLGADRLAWLEARLGEERDRHTILFMHHPPFVTGIGHMDAQRLLDGDALRDVVARHPQVERVLCGHLHRAIQVRFAGTIASTAPSVAHQVALDLRPDGPSAFTLEPPAFQLHLWRDDTGLISHTRAVDTFDGPYPFYRDGELID
jgi:3',5'-cyclic AMP phosphodiesterase CpdA